MITLHHLETSRSQRILWLLEELGVPYELKIYQRDKATKLAPPELKKIHPLGKSPVITDGDEVIAESGAIIEYLVETYGAHAGGDLAHLQPAQRTPELAAAAMRSIRPRRVVVRLPPRLKMSKPSAASRERTMPSTMSSI